jgi:DNA-binding transcriptional ArsR family regulator
MSGLVTGAVLDRYPYGGGERLVAVALADNAHRDGTHIFPSVAEVADRTKLSRRSVQNHIAKMVAAGFLILTRKSTGRRGDTNEYRISAEWLAGGDCIPPAAPVLRTNAKRLSESWGAEFAPHEVVDKSTGWGAASGIMGCSLERHGVQPTAPKPSGTVKELIPPFPPAGGEGGFDATQAGKPRPAGMEAGAGFDAIAAGYPRRAGMEPARKVWESMTPDAALQAVGCATSVGSMRRALAARNPVRQPLDHCRRRVRSRPRKGRATRPGRVSCLRG